MYLRAKLNKLFKPICYGALSSCFKFVYFSFITREQNLLADSLAKTICILLCLCIKLLLISANDLLFSNTINASCLLK